MKKKLQNLKSKINLISKEINTKEAEKIISILINQMRCKSKLIFSKVTKSKKISKK